MLHIIFVLFPLQSNSVNHSLIKFTKGVTFLIKKQRLSWFLEIDLFKGRDGKSMCIAFYRALMTRWYLRYYFYSVDHINIILLWFFSELITSNIILRKSF